MPEKGAKAPDFTLKDQNGDEHSLADFAGKWLVLYFYPKDNTPGCTTEAKDFNDAMAEIERMGAKVVGVSPDSVKSHSNFCSKYDLDLILLSDPDKQVLSDYGAWQKKKMYGREYMGVQRSTVLIDPEGRVAGVWPKVRVKGHVEEVSKTLSELAG
ncbi:MAG: thioredoxin-dependent thiol peroxidase [Planctomycetota bacterium]|nr:thioredoxin-dependent thiol peroxidase [Planctomycetota bacterium]